MKHKMKTPEWCPFCHNTTGWHSWSLHTMANYQERP